MTEVIQPAENREFTSSIGNWTGNASWWTGPIAGRSGLMSIPVGGGGPDTNVSLSYPYVKIPPNISLNFWSVVKIYPPVFSGWFDSATISDETTSITKHVSGIDLPDTWGTAMCFFDTPPSWDKTKSSLTLTMRNILPGNSNVYIDILSLLTPTPPKIDHLPLMGVG